MLAANAALLRLGLFPLQRVTRAMTTTDLLRPSPRPEVAGHGEIAALIETFNTMLDRLEAERATSSARALSAQEAERRRVAQELHDEVGQTLTAVLLELKRVADQARSRSAASCGRSRRSPVAPWTRSAGSPAGCAPGCWRSWVWSAPSRHSSPKRRRPTA